MEPDRWRQIALSFSEVEERETWGHPTFRVRDKIFATIASDGSTCGLRTTKQEQAALVGSAPDTWSVAAYVGQHGWVTGVVARIAEDEARELLADAWARTAPKRLVRVWES